MTTTGRSLTAKDLWRQPEPRDGRRYELVRGALQERSPTGREHGVVTFRVAFILGQHVEPEGLGEVGVGDPGFLLDRDPDDLPAPDVYFISRERLPPGRPEVGYSEIVPDFIVEVVSPHDRASEVQEMIEAWLRAGVRLVWAMYPNTRTVVVHRGLAATQIYREDDDVDGAPVLPNLKVPVAQLFPRG